MPDAESDETQALLEELTALVVGAARVIRERTPGDAEVERKADGSPVTAVDRESESILLAGLRMILPDIPAVSEESGDAAPRVPVFALIDPLDGTREFLAGSSEFTVNVALVAARVPILGVVAAPALGLIWRGLVGHGAERLTFDADTIGAPEKIAARRWNAETPRVMVSRSHLDPESAGFVSGIPGAEREPCGSALKFCRLAEGAADLYVRLAPTCEWDIAAGDALLTAAGGRICGRDGSSIAYGRAATGYRVPAFIAYADPEMAEKLPPPA